MPTTTSASPVTTEKVYSYSRLMTFDPNQPNGCLRKGYIKYILGRPEPSGLPAKIGKILHLAMNKVIQEGYSPEEAVYFAIYESDGLPEGEKVVYLFNMLNAAYRRLHKIQGEYADLTSEQHIKVEVLPGIYLQGYFDVIVDDPANDEITIVDFKSSWAAYDANTSMQLPLYAKLFTMMRSGYSPSSFKGLLIFPRCNDEADSEVVFTEELLDEAFQWALNTIKMIESLDPSNIENYPMTSNRKACENCPYVTLCASGMVEGLPGDGVPVSEEEAQKIGLYVLLQELAVKQMKEGLKAFVKESKKPIEISGGQWDFVTSEPSPKIPIAVLRQFAEDNDLNIDDVLSQETKKVKEWIEADVTGFLKSQATYTTPRSTFKFSDDKPEVTEATTAAAAPKAKSKSTRASKKPTKEEAK